MIVIYTGGTKECFNCHGSCECHKNNNSFVGCTCPFNGPLDYDVDLVYTGGMQYTKIDEIRFWSKVKVTNKEGCWYWNNSKHSFGYGWFRINKKTYLAHRLALIFYTGKEDVNLQANHKCNNPSCCNPNHLYWGTQKDNIQDSIKAGTKTDPPKNGINPPIHRGTDNHFTKLTEDKVRDIRCKYKNGEKVFEISKKYGISKSTVYQIANYKSWNYI